MTPSSTTHLQPYLTIRNAARAIDLYVELFGMRERYRLEMGDRIGHAELELGSLRLALSDEFPEQQVHGPASLGGTSVALIIQVDEVDALVERALAAGCRQLGETEDQFYGVRLAKIIDPFGHMWFLHQVLETLEPDEIKRRFVTAYGQG